MSWVVMYSCSAICPCGKGKITQKTYGDDWNRFQDGPVVIECEICAKKYRVEEETHRGMLTSDGSWSTYYLTPKDYPSYQGPKESDLYPPAVNQYQDFPVWLIEHYSEEELRNVLDLLKSTTSSARLRGTAAVICKAHKKAKKTVRVSEIAKTVEMALEKYPEHAGNKIQREEIRKKESDAYNAYICEKRKHQTIIDLKRG